MYGDFAEHLQRELAAIEDGGLYKHELSITSAQGAHVAVVDGGATCSTSAPTTTSASPSIPR
jgi:hypothetical protein